jgi:methyltransferase-like protein 6
MQSQVLIFMVLRYIRCIFTTEKLEEQASGYWDAFYRYNKSNFFKERHWFLEEFAVLKDARRILEVGCGTGSSIYPMLSIHEDISVYACDFAEHAVELVKQHKDYSTGRVIVFCNDITRDPLIHNVPEESIDICMMIFVLSAISPSRMRNALANVNSTLRPGGMVCFRDYCSGDLAQIRLAATGKQQMIEHNFYARGDGTRAFYFSKDGLNSLFLETGFEPVSVEIISRQEVNRKNGVMRDRKYVQATYKKVSGCHMESLPDVSRGALQVLHQDNRPSTIEIDIGVLHPRIVADKNPIEIQMAQFLVRHPEICIGAVTIEIATMALSCSGALSFAALNASSMHVVISSEQTHSYLKHIYDINSPYFMHERLRLIKYADRMSTESAMHSVLRSYMKKRYVLLVLDSDEADDRNAQIALACDIASIDVHSIIIVACPRTRVESLSKCLESLQFVFVPSPLPELNLKEQEIPHLYRIDDASDCCLSFLRYKG